MIGVVRQDINTRAMAFILAALSSHTRAPRDDSSHADQPSFDELVEPWPSSAGACSRRKRGGNLEAGKAMMRRKIEEAQAQLTERNNQ
jgi:hypothetical protein